MSSTSFVLSSLLSLVALLDSNPTATTCINSTVVKNIAIEGIVPQEKHGLEWLKEKWTGSCGPLKFESSEVSRVQQWFLTRGLVAHPISVFLSPIARYEVDSESITLPLYQSSSFEVFSRFLVKSYLKQNSVAEQGLGFEVATDLVLSDIFDESFVNQKWADQSKGLLGAYSNRRQDCSIGLVPVERYREVCLDESLRTKLSPWGHREMALKGYAAYKATHSLNERIQTSRDLLALVRKISQDKSLDKSPIGIDHLYLEAKKLFAQFDSSPEVFKRWREQNQIQVVVTEQASSVKFKTPPSNTLVLGFDSGFHLTNGEIINLDEHEVFEAAHRVAFVSCKSPTVAEILEYSGRDKRLLFIENCSSEEPIDLSMFAKFGAQGFEHLNPNRRFVQFHQPSVKLALDWGLEMNDSFDFQDLQKELVAREDLPDEEAESAIKMRRLFGWDHLKKEKIVSAPLPVVEVFSARKDETLTLRRLL